MTTIKINSIKYKHFKHFDDFTLDLQGKPAIIRGRNGTGKTSLSDGFQWLLFGKDSLGRKMNPKPLDHDNKEILGLAPSVEADLLIDGQPVTLKRVQEEKWTTKRGELEKTRASDTTKYYIDGVPKKEKDWKEYLASIGGEDKLQMLSTAAFFMQMDWKNRRKLLVDLIGITDEDIIQSTPDLSDLLGVLAGKTIEEKVAILKAQKTEVKRDIEGVPAKIQEVTDMKAKLEASISDLDREELQMSVLEKEAEISDLQSKLDILKSGDGTLDYKFELSEAQLKLTQAERQYLTDTNLETDTLQEDVMKKQTELNQLRRDKADLESESYRLTSSLDSKKAAFDAMKAERKRVDQATFDEHKKTCATCGQDLPTDQVHQMVADFNQRKSQWLEQDKAQGSALKAEIQELDKKRSSVDGKIIMITNQLETAQASLDLLNNELTQIKSKIKPFNETKKAKDIQANIDLINKKILDAAKDSSEGETDLRNQITMLRTEIADLQAKYQSFDQLSVYDNRIIELKTEDKRLKELNQDVERQLWLLEEFTRVKIRKVEDSVNSLFENVKWKMFDDYQNGGLKEMCEPLLHGVEYTKGLSSGEMGRVDIEIVKGLFKGNEIELPIFMDNAERITEPYSLPGQLIELFATPGINKLEVEV